MNLLPQKLGADKKRVTFLGGLLLVAVLVYFWTREPSAPEAHSTSPLNVAPVQAPVRSVPQLFACGPAKSRQPLSNPVGRGFQAVAETERRGRRQQDRSDPAARSVGQADGGSARARPPRQRVRLGQSSAAPNPRRRENPCWSSAAGRDEGRARRRVRQRRAAQAVGPSSSPAHSAQILRIFFKEWSETRVLPRQRQRNRRRRRKRRDQEPL